MRREGRIHGSYVRMSKHDEFEYNRGAPRKPTNQSRVTSACLHNRVRCFYCHDAPVLKAMCKTKGKYKLKDLDITRNYRLHEFTLGSQLPRAVASSSPGLSDYYGPSGEDLRDNSDSEYDGYDDRLPYEMTFSITSFLSDVREVHEVTLNAGTPDSISEEENFDETSQHGVSDEPDIQIDIETDSDCSWSGVDISDSEQAGADVDGWYLVG